jgi:hypothetical protein
MNHGDRSGVPLTLRSSGFFPFANKNHSKWRKKSKSGLNIRNLARIFKKWLVNLKSGLKNEKVA